MLATDVKTVISLIKNGMKIDVIVTMSRVPLYAVTHFWSTLQMNYMTSRGFCSLYPQLTFARVGLMTPAVLSTRASIPRFTALRLIDKYLTRGFKLFTRAQAITTENHGNVYIAGNDAVHVDDGSSYRCHEFRGSEDEHCFTVTFDTEDKPFKVRTPIDRNAPAWI